jgi:hypothetical protein
MAPRTTAPAAPGAVSGTQQQQLAKLSPTPASLREFARVVVAQAPTAKAPKPTAQESLGQSASVNEPAATPDASVLAKERARQQLAQQQLAQRQLAQQQLAQDQLAEKKREAEMTRKVELARKAAQAKRDAELKRKIELANEAQARHARPASSITPPRNESTSTQMQIASAPPQSHGAIGGAGAGSLSARTEPPIYSAPIVAKVAPGIPVAPHAILISTPDHSVYWSLQNSGLIYRTNDRKSWTPESTGVQAELLAGMAPTDTVCWAVGRKGVILLTTDGFHWERVKSPTASDVIGIVAASKDVATIFTAGGVNYSTFDGGSNWEQAN